MRCASAAALPSKAQEEIISNGVSTSSSSSSTSTVTNTTNSVSSKKTSSSSSSLPSLTSISSKLSSVVSAACDDKKTLNHSVSTSDEDYQYIEQNVSKKLNDYQDENSVNDQKNNKANGVAFKTSSSSSKLNTQKDLASKKGKAINTKDTPPNNTFSNNKDEVIMRYVSGMACLSNNAMWQLFLKSMLTAIVLLKV